MDANRQEGFVFDQPRSLDERRRLAQILPGRLMYRLPLALDPLDARAERAFSAWPERIYVLDVGGRVAYKGAPGPFGFAPEEAEAHLARLLGPG